MSDEYLVSLKKFAKWHHLSRNICKGDIVLLHENVMIPMQWPLGRTMEAHSGSDGHVRVSPSRQVRELTSDPSQRLPYYYLQMTNERCTVDKTSRLGRRYMLMIVGHPLLSLPSYFINTLSLSLTSVNSVFC